MTNYKPFDLEAAKRGEPTRLLDVGEHVPFEKLLLGKHYSAILTYQGNYLTFKNTDGRFLDFSNYRMVMVAQAIPEGFTAYDPNVPPPENAEEIECLWDSGNKTISRACLDPYFPWADYRQLVAYRVTKWKEDKPSLEDAISIFSSIIRDVNLHDVTDECVCDALQQFADAIVQRAVDKSREDRG